MLPSPSPSCPTTSVDFPPAHFTISEAALSDLLSEMLKEGGREGGNAKSHLTKEILGFHFSSESYQFK